MATRWLACTRGWILRRITDKSQSPNPKLQIPRLLGVVVWDLGFGVWALIDSCLCERSEIVLLSIEIPQRVQLRIGARHFLRLHSASADSVKKKRWTKSILCQQRLDARQCRPAVDSRQRMREAVDLHDGDVVIAKQIDHPCH